MAYNRASDEMFLEAAIKTVAKVGVENTRTKDIAEYTGFSEASMYRRFPTKEILLREAFLYIDNRLSSILTQSALIRQNGSVSFEEGLYDTWKKIFRYLIKHREETIFLIRYRYSSLYTDEVRSRRQAYTGGLDRVYEAFVKHFGKTAHSDRGFLLSYIFEMTLCFAEKIIAGKLEDSEETENNIWLAVGSAVQSWARRQSEKNKNER